MFRRFRHKLFMLLQVGVLASGTLAIVLQPAAWKAVLLVTLGSTLTALVCGRIARRYLHATLGRLRRAADDIGRGRPAATLDVQPGDDMYKLTNAVNLLATRLAEASREEQRLNDELRRRERLAFLGELAASVAHEINNPLDGVQNCARILRRSGDDPQRAGQMLDLIDNGLGRIELIVRRLLTLAREHVVRPTEGRMSEVVGSAIEAVRPRIDGRVEITRDFTAEDDRVLVDRALLEQVFVNLVINAADSMAPLEASRDGHQVPCASEGRRDHEGAASASVATLSVTTRRESGPAGDSTHEDVLCVDVADTGTGVAPEILPHIFEPFFTTKPGGKGTGLGLAIAARIVDAHRGTITVTPRREGGTIFTVRIPAAMGDKPPACHVTDPRSVQEVAAP